MTSNRVTSAEAPPIAAAGQPASRQAKEGGARPGRTPGTQKFTVKLGYVDMGQVELLVKGGFNGNRTDFVRNAIRNQVTQHSDVIKPVVARKMFVFGMQHISRHDLEQLELARQKLTLRVVGLATIASDVTPELALATIDTLEVLGALHASAEVKRALSGRLK